MSTSLPPRSAFRAASEAAEHFLTFAGLVALYGPPGAVDQLYPFLMPGRIKNNLLDLFNEHCELLNGLRERFTVVRSGPPIRRGNKLMHWNPVLYNSAHEAATDIGRIILRMLVEPLEGITDETLQWTKAKELLAAYHRPLAFPQDGLETLRAGIRDERAALLDWFSSTGEQAATARATKPKRNKPGRKSTAERDQKIYDEYGKGLEAGKWDGQCDYLRKKHAHRWSQGANAAKAWLSSLLRRVRKKEALNKSRAD